MNRTFGILIVGLFVMAVSPIDAAWCQRTSTSKPIVNTAKQNAFANRLEKLLLEMGLSPEVFVRKGRLIIFMPVSKAMVYQLITKGRLLQQAYDLGFKGLDFAQSYGQYYLFSLENGIPRCDAVRKLCL